MAIELIDVGNFIVMISTGAIVPTLLVVYKSRCKRCCFGCIEHDVMQPDANLDTTNDEP
eukprot:SAG11_NODE_1830_length_4192_cov_7.908403_3_plen_59_part_00